jgi:DNA topoisomerase-3
MTQQIVITEKTSQAKDVRAAVGSRFGVILPAEGHLFDLREPEEVVPAWKRWTSVLLRPNGLYGTKPAIGGNKAPKLKAIREALHKAGRVWLATDCDREGQLIGQEILEHYDYRGEVMRVIFTAQDPQTIREAFARAKPNADYARLYAAAVARRQADQIYNLSLTRTATVTLGQGARAVIGVGRVKTPTLAIVCRRELEIRGFVAQAYFEVVATARADGGQLLMRHAPSQRILRRSDAETIAAAADGFTGPLDVRVEDKRQGPPRLHDLPSLQKLCATRFGWSAARTLEIAQELYDGQGKKVITYPRAETRYLPESLIPDVPKIVAGLQVGRAFSETPMPATPVIRRGGSGAFHDKGLAGASHHAVIPNVNTVDTLREVWPRLSGDERRLFDVIARSYLAAMMPDFRYRQTSVALDAQGRLFRATGRQPIVLGWREAFPQWQPAEEKGDDAQLLPVLRQGEVAVLDDVTVEAKETRPPPRYNEGTLVDAMQHAWRFVADEVLQERLKEAKGIGTPATRAEIIRGLKTQEFLVTQGKYIVPTDRGLSLFAALERADPALVDPGVTAQMERLLDDVLVGQQGMMEAIDAVCAQASRIIGRLQEGAAAGDFAQLEVTPAAKGTNRPPTPAMKRFVDSLARQKRLPPPQGYATSSAVCRTFLDQHAPAKPANGAGDVMGAGLPATAPPPPPKRTSSRRAVGRTAVGQEQAGGGEARQPAGRKKQNRKTGDNPPGQAGGTASSPTKLHIPFGNKDVAVQLGARYGPGGWYAPPGVDLKEFCERGWM